jgi:hypothetical protein
MSNEKQRGASTNEIPGPFIETSMWRTLVEESYYSVDVSARRSAAKALTVRDLRALLEKLESGSANEQVAALVMFLDMVLASAPAMFESVADVRSTLDQVHTELCDQLVALATNWESQRDSEWPDGHLPLLNVPGRAYFVLSQLDRERAAHFLIGHFDYVKLSKWEREEVIHELIGLCSVPQRQRSETAMARLIEIAEEAAPGAERAIDFLRGLRLAQQCIGLPHSLEQLGVTGDVWESWSVRLQPPGTFDFDDSVLEEALRNGNSGLSAAALLFRAEFAREKGQDSQILTFMQRAVELLPDNPATLDAIVGNLESFHRPGDALRFAERLAEVDPEFTNRWRVGKMRYLSGDKAGAIEFWRSLPFYKEPDGEDKLKLYIDGCERRLVQYEQHKASKK